MKSLLQCFKQETKEDVDDENSRKGSFSSTSPSSPKMQRRRSRELKRDANYVFNLVATDRVIDGVNLRVIVKDDWHKVFGHLHSWPWKYSRDVTRFSASYSTLRPLDPFNIPTNQCI